jgi:hypothetical protein
MSDSEVCADLGTQAGSTGRPVREVEAPATGGGAGNRTRRPDPRQTGISEWVAGHLDYHSGAEIG